MFNIGDVLWQLFYLALLVLLFVMVVKAVRFFIKNMTKITWIIKEMNYMND